MQTENSFSRREWLRTSLCALGLGLMSLQVSAQESAAGLKVYFGTSGKDTKGIYFSKFDPATGKLTAAELAAETPAPGFLALHPDGDKLYAVTRQDKEPVVTGYKIGPKGELTVINSSPIEGGAAAHVSVHPSGKFVLTAQYGGGTTALLPLSKEGVLGKSQVSQHEGGSKVVAGRQEAPHPHWTGFSPDQKYAFVPDLGLDGIVIYKIEDLETAPKIVKHGFAASEAGGGARHMRFSHDGKFIYLLNELTLSVTTFAWDAAKGEAKLMSTVPTLSEEQKNAEDFNSAAEILVHPSDKFVYSSNRGHDTVSVFKTHPSEGKVELIQIQPVRGAFPRNINMDPSGKWLLAAGADSNTVSVHQIDQETGKLKYITQRVINVPGPICILFVP